MLRSMQRKLALWQEARGPQIRGCFVFGVRPFNSPPAQCNGANYPSSPAGSVAGQYKAAGRKGSKDLHLLAKRLIDIIVSLGALVLLLPVFLLIALAIRLESPGPALFTQYRWGRDLKPFRVYKFRSMATPPGDPGLKQAVRNDARVTRLGSILRRSNLDELPQLLNVLKGDMSLVGPRCHPIGMRAAGVPYETLVPDYHARHLVRPGLTGLAQVHGYRGPTTDARAAIARIQYDLQYIGTFTVWLDLKIMALTLVREIRSGGTGF